MKGASRGKIARAVVWLGETTVGNEIKDRKLTICMRRERKIRVEK